MTRLFIPRKGSVDEADQLVNHLAVERWGNSLHPKELCFHFPTSAGALVSGVSDFQTSPINTAIFGIRIDTTTFSTNFTITVYKNAVSIQACAVTAAGTSKFLIYPNTPVVADTDQFTVNATTPGTGNMGVFVKLGLVT